MISIFNRKELTTSYSLDKLSKTRELLDSQNIDYTVKTVNRKSPSPFSAGSRARTGTFGEKVDLMYEYIIYVKKQDYEKARHFL